jgi:RNA polymerase sigma-70 factor (ECF subfamily)
MDKEEINQIQFEESRLISLLNEDSEYAFQLIYDKYRNRIYQTAIKFLKSPIIAQDVVQDVFMKLWFERHKMNASKPIEAWLYTVAKNNILNKLRKIANDWKAIDLLSHTILQSVNNADQKLNEGEFKQNLESAVSKLPDQQKMVFILSRFERLSYLQISEKLGISPLTVKTHLSRALYSIRKYFEGKGVFFMITWIILYYS